MTKPKPSSFKAKRGRKTKREKERQIKMLQMLSKTDDLTAWQASLAVGCSYEFALRYFQTPRYMVRMVLTRRDKFRRDPNGFPIDYSSRLDRIFDFAKLQKDKVNQTTKCDILNFSSDNL